MQNNQSNSYPNTYSAHTLPPSDEIDLRELMQCLWAGRLTIVVTVGAVLIAALIYVFFAKPTYEVEVRTVPPPASGLAEYNRAARVSGLVTEGVASVLGDGSPRGGTVNLAVSPNDAYGYFMRHVASSALQRAFYEEYIAPAADGDADAAGPRRFGKDGPLTVTLPRNAADNNIVTMTWQGHDPDKLVEWANLYVEAAISESQNELAQNLVSQIDALHTSLDEQVETLRAGARMKREQEVATLEDALELAAAIGLENPPVAGNLVSSYTGETTYMRGTKALETQIALLKNRSSDDLFIPGLVDILELQTLLGKADVQPEQIAVARIDEVASIPDGPIKPRKALILALAIVVGGMAGIFIVLMRQMFRS